MKDKENDVLMLRERERERKRVGLEESAVGGVVSLSKLPAPPSQE